jgi:hypothetical protein
MNWKLIKQSKVQSCRWFVKCGSQGYPWTWREIISCPQSEAWPITLILVILSL